MHGMELTMTDFALTGALAGLKVLTVEDRTRYRAAVQAGGQMGWGYYFPYLLVQYKPGQSAMLIAEDSGSLCVFRWKLKSGSAGTPRPTPGKSGSGTGVRPSTPRPTPGKRAEPHLDLYLPPIPFDPAVLRRCLERANDFNSDHSAQVIRVDARDAALLENDGTLRVRPRREQYIFAPKEYGSLAGNTYRTIRRNVATVERLAGLEVLPFSAKHAEACQNLLERWSQQHREAHGTAGGVGISKRAIELAVAMCSDELCGEVVFIEGKLVGFAFGGEIRPGLACSFERKCDTSVRGLSFYQLRSLLLRLQNFDLVNDGSDTGRSGLKQLKDSFRPVQMHMEYHVAQRAKAKASIGGAPRGRKIEHEEEGRGGERWEDGGRRVGLLCNCKRRGDPVAKLSPSLLNRAILLGEELARDGIEVFLLSPRRVQANGEVAGYLVKGRDLQPMSAQIPRINANWTYATRELINRGMGYERFKRWTRERGIEIYVPYELSELVSNKRDTFELVSDHDPRLHPRTEDLNGTAEQIESFLQRSSLAFVKPRAGHKGERIFVLRRCGSDYSLKHYHGGVCRSLEPITIGAAMAIMEIAATDTPYVIQEGIESLRFRGSVFDVRVVMVNDGSQWHSILETRLAPPGSDLSNIFQGGSSHVTEEFLEAEIGQAAGQALLEKIRRVSHGVAEHLESRFPGHVMELGLDLVLDRDLGIHLVEINAKPGLAGRGAEKKFFEWKPEDQAYYDQSVRPHIRHLANFLRSKVERSSREKEILIK
jgi:hypothetical protein